MTELSFTWTHDAVPWDSVNKVGTPAALDHLEQGLLDHVWNAAALEDNPLTPDQVASLFAIPPADPGFDQQQVLALVAAHHHLAGQVRSGSFRLAKATADRLHRIVAVHEAIESGHFRGEGSVTGGGHVRLGGRGVYSATSATDHGAALRAEFTAGIAALERLSHPVERATAYFCLGTRHQFFFDGNKRTSRIMMNGELMRCGYDPIIVPVARRPEFDRHLVTLYREADATVLMRFLIECALRG
ncbi:Fic family protein [Tersicoccus sp. MR15.9]|uniref:Fic family protein n=1 Tax=Tersicoccus mangrovi TaxID=3121635 RepID=UPI002FE5AA63